MVAYNPPRRQQSSCMKQYSGIPAHLYSYCSGPTISYQYGEYELYRFSSNSRVISQALQPAAAAAAAASSCCMSSGTTTTLPPPSRLASAPGNNIPIVSSVAEPSSSSSIAAAANLIGSKKKKRGEPDESGRRQLELYSPEFYAACAVGGSLCCGSTHLAVTPLDLVKCNMQTDPSKYRSISSGFGVLFREQGLRGFFRGWAPTLLGYSAQGACKYGLYEYFKKHYSDALLPLGAHESSDHHHHHHPQQQQQQQLQKTVIYLASSASAEVVADVALCPFEAVKVRVQTQPGFARGLFDGFPKLVASQGYAGLFKGLLPLWGRQIPYTMMKFACFENTVELLYQHVVPIPRREASGATQLGVSFAAGYIAGIVCAVVSHPADNLVSLLNNSKGATISDAVRKLGVMGLLTRGLPLRIIMIGTLSGSQWAIYDAFKVSMGFPTTGGGGSDVESGRNN